MLVKTIVPVFSITTQAEKDRKQRLCEAKRDFENWLKTLKKQAERLVLWNFF
jgi:hypothetical protein